MSEPTNTEQLADATANLHLDEVTGERISKSELKKRQKARENERKKAEKAAAAPAKPVKKKDEGIDESQLNPNVSYGPDRVLVQQLTVNSNTLRSEVEE